MSSLIQPDPPHPARETLPTMYDLPSEKIGDPGTPDEFQKKCQATSNRLDAPWPVK